MKPITFPLRQPQVADLVARQRACWPLAEQHFRALEQVETRTFQLGTTRIVAQFNPARIGSSAAKVDARSLQYRPCFLCPNQLPADQLRLPYGTDYHLLVNPFPIFREHLTIPALAHAPQRIQSRFETFLELSRDLPDLTLFYNGPLCGASAPDHAHFQAVTQGIMPLDNERTRFTGPNSQLLASAAEGDLYAFTGYGRNGFYLRAHSLPTARQLFDRLYAVLPLSANEDEPRMNLFCYYQTEQWQLVVIPRKRHRPWQYEAEGAERLVSSPGAADIGGLFIAARREDFEKLSEDLLADVYRQVCLSDDEIGQIAHQFRSGI
ncbi:MAG: DUF4922 domain-containing protein [Parabacteroides sp.]|nr:DUF4922 domain-containing protein [Parabacteroides sp.]